MSPLAALRRFTRAERALMQNAIDEWQTADYYEYHGSPRHNHSHRHPAGGRRVHSHPGGGVGHYHDDRTGMAVVVRETPDYLRVNGESADAWASLPAWQRPATPLIEWWLARRLDYWKRTGQA